MRSDLFARHVYILASQARVLYIGSTSDLPRRTCQHKHRLIPGFTSRYRVDRLVYSESHRSIRAAIARERQIKSWRRSRKVDLIESSNAGWLDLAANWFGAPFGQGPSLRPG